ncbi:MAG: 4Fe-4S binding protein [Syntrophorhabdales bacterium]|jgi:NADH-quinone oxidoreductase subunit I|nr:4Fe-4S binding protein [Syntrophorhabdales bacterium]
MVRDVVTGAISLLKGMGVTIKAFFSPVVTVQYPRETINITPRFRGHTKLVADNENPEKTRCIVCGMCERSCPSNSIKVIGEKKEGEKKKSLTKYLLNFTTCSHCGLCVESCPTDALAFSADYNPASFTKETFYYDLALEFEKRKNR